MVAVVAASCDKLDICGLPETRVRGCGEEYFDIEVVLVGELRKLKFPGSARINLELGSASSKSD